MSATGTYLYVFHKAHRNIAKEKPAYEVCAKDLYTEFSTDEKTSYDKYGNQVLQVTGRVVEFELNESGASLVYVDPFEGINCAFDSTTVTKLRSEFDVIGVGDVVTLKGQCDGFDMIMGVVLTRCVLIERNQFLSSLE